MKPPPWRSVESFGCQRRSSHLATRLAPGNGIPPSDGKPERQKDSTNQLRGKGVEKQMTLRRVMPNKPCDLARKIPFVLDASGDHTVRVRARLLAFWDRLKASYWFVPSLMVIGATGLAFATVEVERSWNGAAPDWMPRIFASGAEGARAVLSAIASSMITVATLVFSLTIVALTLASAQFGPRLIRNFMRDVTDQVVLGSFIATFLYSLLVLRSVDDQFVPTFSVGLAVVMVVACVLLLVFFIHHVATTIQVESVIANVSRELLETLMRLLPEEKVQEEDPELPETEPDTFGAPETGYVQALDSQTLAQFARQQDILIHIDVRPGHFVMKGAPILRVWPRGRLSESPEAFRLACVIGSGRTFTQDIDGRTPATRRSGRACAFARH